MAQTSQKSQARRLGEKWPYLIIFLLILLAVGWPLFIKYYYSIFFSDKILQIDRLGQLGDMFGAINTLFALLALSLSILSNNKQIDRDNRDMEERMLNQYRSYRSELFSNNIIYTVYMVQYGYFRYSGGAVRGILVQKFSDTNDLNKKSHHVEAEIDIMLALFEEILIFNNQNFLDSSLMENYIVRINNVASNLEIKRYLEELRDYLGNAFPYPNLLLISKT